MEDKIQADFHLYLRNTYPKTAKLCCHVPNGGLRSQSEAMRFKSMGTQEGWPDYQIMIPAGSYHGLFIEFKDKGKLTTTKVEKGLKLTPHEVRQHDVQDRLRAAGYKVVECDDYQQALREFETYAAGTEYLTKRVVTNPNNLLS